MFGLALDICRFSSTDKEFVHDRHRDIIKKLKFIKNFKREIKLKENATKDTFQRSKESRKQGCSQGRTQRRW